jgi:hypothetical protein
MPASAMSPPTTNTRNAELPSAKPAETDSNAHAKPGSPTIETAVTTQRPNHPTMRHESPADRYTRSDTPQRLLDTETKLLTHACRIAAYNAESALARLVAPHYSRANDEARSLIREALTSAGDLHLADDTIHVTLNPLSAPRRTRALAAMCELLNDTQTIYPEVCLSECNGRREIRAASSGG